MVAVNQPPASDYYYAGIIIVLFFSYTFVQLPVVFASLVGVLCLVGYEAVAIFATKSPWEVIANNTFFLVATNYVGIFAAYSLERYRRRSFLHLSIIEADRAKLSELTTQLQDLSIHDPLTGLLNRRQLTQHFGDELERFRRTGTPAAAMLIDLDDFKAVNDRYGHLAGDGLLRRTARAIAATVRKSDLTFRYGGDEFLVLLPNTSLREARDLAHRLLERFNRFGSSATGFDDAAGISIGVSAIDDADLTTDDVLNSADRALYEAKQRGKGRVAIGENSR
jgi:diguanylate cyclase (GGDEF)-like protein